MPHWHHCQLILQYIYISVIQGITIKLELCKNAVKRLASKLATSSVQLYWRLVMQGEWVFTLDTKPDTICHIWLLFTHLDHQNFKSVIKVTADPSGRAV